MMEAFAKEDWALVFSQLESEFGIQAEPDADYDVREHEYNGQQAEIRHKKIIYYWHENDGFYTLPNKTRRKIRVIYCRPH